MKKIIGLLIFATGIAQAQVFVTSDPVGVNSSGATPCTSQMQFNTVNAVLWLPANPVNHMCTWAAISYAGGSPLVASNEVVASSATPTFSIRSRSSETIVTANITTFTLASGSDGQEKTLTFCQNATGMFTVTAPVNVRGFGTVGVTASLCSSQHFTYHVSQTAWLADSPMVINE